MWKSSLWCCSVCLWAQVCMCEHKDGSCFCRSALCVQIRLPSLLLTSMWVAASSYKAGAIRENVPYWHTTAHAASTAMTLQAWNTAAAHSLRACGITRDEKDCRKQVGERPGNKEVHEGGEEGQKQESGKRRPRVGRGKGTTKSYISMKGGRMRVREREREAAKTEAG